MKKCMISQPRYMPSMTYLQRISMVDVFLAYDDVQRVPRDIENRNRIINPSGGTQWLSVSICSSSRELIKHSQLCGYDDYDKHQKTIEHFYKPTYEYYDQDIVDGYYKALKTSFQMRDSFVAGLKYLLDILEVSTEIKCTSWYEYEKSSGVEQLMNICKTIDADVYVGGLGGRNYGLTEDSCSKYGIQLIEHNEIIEPQVGFFHHLFLHGVEYWKNKMNKLDI